MNRQRADRTRIRYRALIRSSALLLGAILFGCSQPLLVGSMEAVQGGGGGISGDGATCALINGGTSPSTTDLSPGGMLNGNHDCGGVECSAPWPSTAECLAGRCVVTLATCQNAPAGIAVDGSSVYWTNMGVSVAFDDPNSGIGSVMKGPLDGGTPTTLAANQYWPYAIVVDATSVYWTNSGTTINGNYTYGSVMKLPLAGGPATTLAAKEIGPQYIAVDATTVYWTRDDTDGADVMKVSVAGGASAAFADQFRPWGIAVDATSVYWTDLLTSSVIKMLKSGGQPTTLAAGQKWPQGIAVDTTNVYWVTVNGGTVMKVPVNGGTPMVLASGQAYPAATAVDATSIYWTAEGDGTVMKLPLAGGTPTVLASVPGSPGAGKGIAVDATSVYWTDWTSGKVMKVTPK